MADIWHLHGSILSYPAKDVLSSLISDDKINYEKSEEIFGKYIELLDSALELYISIIQGAYSIKTEWQGKSTLEAPLILFSSILNNLFLIRHAILLGYFSETPTLFRNCYERITRGYLFWLNESEAMRFLSGKRRGQKEIDDKLSQIMKSEKEERIKLFQLLRDEYKRLSESSHPDLLSFKSRYGDLDLKQLKDTIIHSPLWGGFHTDELGKPIIYIAVQLILNALRILKLIFVESSGSHEQDYQKIFQQYEEYVKTF
jgi:hypothetical protein